MHDAAREIRRQTYLQALGMDQYVSRRALPGAAETLRLRPSGAVPASKDHENATVDGPAALRSTAAEGLGQTARQPSPPTAPAKAPGTDAVIRFRVAAIQAGGWLWLEDLGDMPLAQEQVQLIAAMATAVCADGGKPVVAQFDWPMHNNQQLDLGPEAATLSLGSFVERQLTDGQCAGLVLLGDTVGPRLPSSLHCPHRIALPGTRAMLESPSLKRQAWAGLMPHVRR